MKIKATTLNIVVVLIMTMLVSFTPAYRLYKLIVIYPLFAIWICTTLAIDRTWIQRRFNVILPILIYCILVLIKSLFNGGDILTAFISNGFLTYVWIIVGAYYIDKNCFGKQQRSLIYIFIIISALFTIKGLIDNPMASRLLATTLESTRDELKAQYIGGYEFIYSLVFLAPAALLVIIKKKIKSLLLWSMIVVGFITVLLASYTTALIFITMLSVLIIIQSTSKRKIGIISLGLAIVAIVLVINFKYEIIDAVSRLGTSLDSDVLVRKMNSLKYAFQSNDYSSLERVELFQNAFQNSINHFAFGELFGSQNLLRSGHSYSLGLIERFGVLGLSVIFSMINYFRLQYSAISEELKHGYLALTIAFFIFITIDTFETSNLLACSIFFIVPTILKTTEDKPQ